MDPVAAMTRAVLIYANSQGEELMRNGRYLRCFADDVTFKWIPLHKVSVDDWEKSVTTSRPRERWTRRCPSYCAPSSATGAPRP